VLPGQKYIEAAGRLEFRNYGVDPATTEFEIRLAAQAIGVVAIVLSESVRRIGDDEVDARIGRAADTVEEIFVEKR
jgi:hypothetical protein